MSAAMTTPPSSRTLTGRHVALALAGFFGVIVAVNLTLALLAARSWSGLVVENSYAAGLHFNQDLAEARRQRALGWTDGVGHDRGRLRFEVRGRDGTPVGGLKVEARLRRPTHDGEDRVLKLSPDAGGVYRAGDALAAGAWDVEIHAGDGHGLRYRRDARLWVAEGSLR
jgi:nitrogen fixation protein FixH